MNHVTSRGPGTSQASCNGQRYDTVARLEGRYQRTLSSTTSVFGSSLICGASRREGQPSRFELCLGMFVSTRRLGSSWSTHDM